MKEQIVLLLLEKSIARSVAKFNNLNGTTLSFIVSENDGKQSVVSVDTCLPQTVSVEKMIELLEQEADIVYSIRITTLPF